MSVRKIVFELTGAELTSRTQRRGPLSIKVKAEGTPWHMVRPPRTAWQQKEEKKIGSGRLVPFEEWSPGAVVAKPGSGETRIEKREKIVELRVERKRREPSIHVVVVYEDDKNVYAAHVSAPPSELVDALVRAREEHGIPITNAAIERIEELVSDPEARKNIVYILVHGNSVTWYTGTTRDTKRFYNLLQAFFKTCADSLRGYQYGLYCRKRARIPS